MARIPRLSKSKFQAGLQCSKRLWLECHHPEVADPISEAQQAIFDIGHRVGELARMRFPDGVLVAENHTQSDAALETTTRLLGEGISCLYEAAFGHDGVLVRADVVRRTDEGVWQLIEVKASNSLKQEHVTDAAIQTYVLRGAGLPVDRTYLLHLNRDYVYPGGPHDLKELFLLEDVSAEVEAYLPCVPALLGEMKTMLAGDCPHVRIGRRCATPYDCEFLGYCYGFLPEFPVTDIPRLSDDLLGYFLDQGIYSIKDVPLEYSGLSPDQRTVCRVIQSGEPHIGDGLADELAGLEFPLHFLDFETVMYGLPRYVGTRPYQTVPVQWSCHTLHEDGTLEHHEYLHREGTDPRPALTEHLLAALSGSGTVVAYTGYEATVLKGLAESQPQWASTIAEVQARLFDLHKVIKRHVCHPDFHGRTSLKCVLPALVEDVSYEGLAVPNGEVAMLRYNEAVWGDLPGPKCDAVFEDLLEYCATDTLAMVRLFENLKRKS
jgi:hypothetical protein